MTWIVTARAIPPTKPRKKRQNIEEMEQTKFSTWLKKKDVEHSASANGGKRSLSEGVRFKRMGVSAGYPDLTIPYPFKGYHGLYIEFKRPDGGTVSPEQTKWLNFLNAQGYYAKVAYGCEDAKAIFADYFSGHSSFCK